jgi:hypothetical protein
MCFFWWSLVLLGPFLSSDRSSLFQPFLSPWVSKSKLSPALHSLLSCSPIKLKSSEIQYRTSELWGVSGEAWSRSVPSSVLTTLHFFSRFSHHEFQNPNFLLPLRSLLSCGSIQPRNSEIRYCKRELWAFSGEAWSWSVPSSVFTHLHFFSRFSRPEF